MYDVNEFCLVSSILHSPLHYWLMFCQWGDVDRLSSGGSSSSGQCIGLWAAVTSVFCPVVGSLWSVVSVLRLCVWLTRCVARVQLFYGVSCNHDKWGIVSNIRINFGQSLWSANIFSSSAILSASISVLEPKLLTYSNSDVSKISSRFVLELVRTVPFSSLINVLVRMFSHLGWLGGFLFPSCGQCLLWVGQCYRLAPVSFPEFLG